MHIKKIFFLILIIGNFNTAFKQQFHRLSAEYTVKYKDKEGNPVMKMGKVFYDIKRACNAVLVGMVKCEENNRVLLKNPEGDITIEEKDYLLLLVNGMGEKNITKMFHTKEGLID